MQSQSKNSKKITDIFKSVSLLAIVVSASTITLSISYLEYLDFTKTAQKIESKYTTSQKKLIKDEVNKVTHYIALKRSQIQQRSKQRIKARVYEAHAIATNIYNKFNGSFPDSKIKKLIVAALRPLRFFNNDGYFFIQSLNGVNHLHPLWPEIEEKNVIEFKSANGRYLVKDLNSLIIKSEEGFLSYNYTSFKSKKDERSKITYVKRFKPYNWYIGTGDYLDNIKHDVQQELLDYIGQIKFGTDSYIFVVSYDGTVLMNSSQRHLIGTNIWNLEDPNGIKVVQEERKAVDNPEGEFIYYVWNKPSTSIPSPKVSFMKGVKDWQWMIGAGIYTDDVQIEIQKQKNNLKTEIVKQLGFVFIISIIIGIFIIYFINKIASRFSIELHLFMDFFKNLSVQSDKINIDSFKYAEFKELARTANRMLEKQIEIEDERIKTEDLLRTSEATLKEAQKITHFGSWKYNIVTDKLMWSDEVFRIFELDQLKIIPSYDLFLESIHPDDRNFVNNTYKQSVKNKTPYNVEHRIKLKGGKIKLVREHGETYYDENGEAIRSMGTVQDITEIRSKEEQLKRSQKMDALGKLTGGIAHDYNNILGIILGYSDLLMDQVANDSKLTGYVEHIKTASKRGRNLTKKLMTFSRYKNSKKTIIDINNELKNQQHMLEKTLTARIELVMNLTYNVWPIEVDLDDLNDSIVNMAINSSHAIESNGKITIKTENIHLSSYDANNLNLKTGDYVALSIIDTGVGMNAQTQSKIFDPFFTTKGDRGTGLGLSQVYGFVTRCNGSVSIESELDHGTEFTLYFPHCSLKPTESEETSNVKSESKGNETILVVDDELALCEMADNILKNNGYQVLTANNAQQALEILKNNKIDLLLSDIIMPNMNGFQLASEVMENYPDVMIQLVSGFNDTVNLTKNKKVSDLDVFQKPYTKAELLSKIRKVIDLKN